MVKIPEKTPNWQNIIGEQSERVFKLSEHPVIQKLIHKTDQYYYYWDKVRSQPLPEEFDKKEVWSFIRFRRRMNSSQVPILDLKGNPFAFWLTEEIQKNLHYIDQSMSGNLTSWDSSIDRKASAKYMLGSLLEESITSSQIEGAVATIKDAKKMLLEERKPKNNSEQMIYNNFLTMQSIKEICKQDLSLQVLQELHVLITKHTLNSSEDEGKFRTAEDNVNVVTSYGEILFTPPSACEVQSRLDALIRFANDSESTSFIHPVVKAILLHFWLAYIHPFIDGNGRMARTLFYWYMLKHEYRLFEYTSISKIILKKTTKYAYAYLYSEHDDNDLTYFIHFHIEVIMSAIEELKQHIVEEREKKYQMHLQITEYPDLNLRQTRILQHIVAHPRDILTIKIHQNLNQVAYQTARTDLQELEEKGWIKSIKKGKTYYYVSTDKIWNISKK